MADGKCGCSGIRKCLLCENNTAFEPKKHDINGIPSIAVFHFCLNSKKIEEISWEQCYCFLKGVDNQKNNDHVSSQASARNSSNNKVNLDSFSSENSKKDSLGISCDFFHLDDVTVIEDFVTKEDEIMLQTEMYKLPWKLSQSGRRKQDFGPQVNFKRKKLKIGNFTGLPSFLRDVVSKMKSCKELSDFNPVEVCHLEYSTERGSSIDPHIDDKWLWGEHLITLNLLSSSILTLSHDDHPKVCIQVPMPRFSLLILKGKARNIWKHSIKREDISGLRIAVTFRELSRDFLTGSQSSMGDKVLEIAKNFNGKPLFNKETS